MITRNGIGYDIHRFGEGRDLWLGGVKIPYDKGLIGHSDADVILHAIADSLLGAAGLGDIGKHFPDDDPAWKDARSLMLLKEIRKLLTIQSYSVINIDVTLLMEEPKIADYSDQMRENISNTLGIMPSQINIKATTNEQLGAIGKGEGAAAFAVSTIQFR